MSYVLHGVSWLFIKTSHYTGQVFGLGTFVTGVCVCVCVCQIVAVYSFYSVHL